MGRFQSTVSTIAALTTVAAAGATGWKLAQQQHTPDAPDKEIMELRAKVAELEKKPQSTPQVVVPVPAALPPALPPEPPVDSSQTGTQPQPGTP